MAKHKNEFDLIESLFAAEAGREGLGLKDDAACWQPPPDKDIILSVDMLVAGVHFPTDAAPALVAARLVGSALSDLAAKGAEPAGCLLTLALGDWDDDFLSAFAAALHKDLAHYNMPLWGGDTTAAPIVSVSLSVYGVVPTGAMIKRSGANIGDTLYVSGSIGGGIVGLQNVLKGEAAREAAREGGDTSIYTNPTPRLLLGQSLRGIASASIDISDGLLADCQHICTASNVAMDIDCAAIPLFNDTLPFDEMITGGDDYELAFTAPASAATAITALAETLNLPLTPIGKVKRASKNDPITLTNPDGSHHPLPKKRGYSH